MQISWDHLSDLFFNFDNIHMREYWAEASKKADNRSPLISLVSVLNVKDGENQRFNEALELDLKSFVQCLPTDGRTPEVKERLRKDFIARL
jgi:hypothetical protein